MCGGPYGVFARLTRFYRDQICLTPPPLQQNIGDVRRRQKLRDKDSMPRRPERDEVMRQGTHRSLLFRLQGRIFGGRHGVLSVLRGHHQRNEGRDDYRRDGMPRHRRYHLQEEGLQEVQETVPRHEGDPADHFRVLLDHRGPPEHRSRNRPPRQLRRVREGL